jgi:hypothetical protein
MLSLITNRVWSMAHPPRLHFIRSVIRGLLILLCVLAVPKLALSESDTAADQGSVSSKRPKAIRQDGGYPQRTSISLHQENKDCAVAKLDIWLQHGTVTHSVSPPDAGWRTWTSEKGRTMIIGGKDCRIRVRIEPVSADTSIFE